nr:MAG TPA: envelope glycoprotein [Caudoviricetes sp.]DAT26113.1 MAG TPA: envelope glycoprotein [Caudoviricetes sp.]
MKNSYKQPYKQKGGPYGYCRYCCSSFLYSRWYCFCF